MKFNNKPTNYCVTFLLWVLFLKIADFTCETWHKRRFCTIFLIKTEIRGQFETNVLGHSLLQFHKWVKFSPLRKTRLTNPQHLLMTPKHLEHLSPHHFTESLLNILWFFPLAAFLIWWSLKLLMSDHKQPWILPVTERDTTSIIQ